MLNLQSVEKELQKMGYATSIQVVLKNNTPKEGLTVMLKRQRNENQTGLTFYADILNQMYSAEEIAQEIARIVQKAEAKVPDLSWIDNREEALKHCCLNVCRSSWNAQRLEDAFVFPIENTDLVYYVSVQFVVPDGNFGNTIASRKMGCLQEIPEQELFRIAKQNTKEQTSIMSMGAMLDQEGWFAPAEEDMIIVSNKNKFHGAACGFLEESLNAGCEICKTDRILIIPSSIHEVLYFSKIQAEKESLLNTINHVNREMLDGTDILSNHAYLWDGKTLQNYL